jgi:diacylglycerol kinase
VVAPLIDKLPPFISHGMISWYRAKMFVEHASIVSSDAIHVLVGVLVWMLAALITRRSLATWLPWLAVLALALLNEAVDLAVERWPDLAMQLGESAKDIWLTMTLPTLLLIAVRLRPNLFRAASRRR